MSNIQIQQLKQNIKTITIRINKQKLLIKQEDKELKTKQILLRKISQQFQEFQQQLYQEDEKEQQYQQILNELADKEYQQLIEISTKQYSLKMLDYDVNVKAANKSQFKQKQEFLSYKDEDNLVINTLQQIDEEKKKLVSNIEKKSKVTQEMNKLKPQLNNISKKVKNLNYDKQYYEYMIQDLFRIISDKKDKIFQLYSSLQYNKTNLEELQYELSCQLLIEQGNFHKCIQHH